MPKSDLPFASQFSPVQTPLPKLLSIVEDSEGQPLSLLERIRDTFFSQHGGGDEKQRLEVAKNTILALMAYGILDEDRKPTDFGRRIMALRHDPESLYEAFARHILLDLRGLEFVNTIVEMNQSRREITLETLAHELRSRGIYVPRGGMHMSGMKGWLGQAGIFRDGYDVDEQRLQEVLGTSLETVQDLAQMGLENRAFLRALALLDPSEGIPSSEVAEYASALYGVSFPEKSMPKVLAPLESAGFIHLTKSTSGRGAKPHLVQGTDKLRKDLVDPIISTLEASTGLSFRPLWNKSLAETLEELQSSDRAIKGRGLEALAIYLCRLLDLTFIRWRHRSQATAGAEVDVIAESARLIFSRWQIQCKNTGTVSLDDVAKEVGVAQLLRSNVIMMVTTGRIGREAKTFANRIMEEYALQIATIDGADLRRIAHHPLALLDILDREAKHAMEVKRLKD